MTPTIWLDSLVESTSNCGSYHSQSVLNIPAQKQLNQWVELWLYSVYYPKYFMCVFIYVYIANHTL